MLQSYYVTHAVIKLHVTQVLHRTAITLQIYYVTQLLNTCTTAVTLHPYIRCSASNVSNGDCLIYLYRVCVSMNLIIDEACNSPNK